jgi:hypothetical protein
MFVGHLNGRVWLTTPAAETDYSIAAYTPSSVEAVWTSCFLANCIFVNRTDRAPWSLVPSGSAFASLANWNGAWTCGLLRSCGGALVALNMTETGVSFPTKVRTSSFAVSNTVPASWDETNPATNATANILSQLEGAIVDACSFGNNLIIYGHNQAWLMQKSTGFEIFDYYKLPFQKGAINANCSVEVDGLHYVFGPDDIWRHDGVSEKSICQGRVRDFIFQSINNAQFARCFVFHNPILKEVHFCYVASDRGVKFNPNSVTGCNRQAVYNYLEDTWSFDDVPSCFSAAYSNLNVAQTWATISGSWNTVGGAWLSYEDGFRRTPVYVGNTNSTYSLTAQVYAFDLFGAGSTTTFPVDTFANGGLHVERDGIDLDQIDGVNLPDYKLVNSIYPLARIDVSHNTTLNIQLGSADFYGQPPQFNEAPTSFDGNTLYKLDFNATGRYLSMIVDYNDYTSCFISGFDFEVDTTGHR